MNQLGFSQVDGASVLMKKPYFYFLFVYILKL